jgi:peptide/nickel transport system substrate-binding protein
VRSSEFATFYQDVIRGRFQLYTLQWVGGSMVDPDILRRVYHSTQTPTAGGFNRGFYSNPEVDRLLDEASTAATKTLGAGPTPTSSGWWPPTRCTSRSGTRRT